MAFLFLALVGVPILEIALFIEIGGAIGTWPTIATIFLTAAIGAFLLRSQGSGLMARARATLDRGEMPVEEVIHGLFLLIAGALLLTPGFFTDAVGFLLCVPSIRLALGRAVLRRFRDRMTVRMSTHSFGPDPHNRPGQPPPSDPGPAPGVTGGPTKWRPPEDPSDDDRRP